MFTTRTGTTGMHRHHTHLLSTVFRRRLKPLIVAGFLLLSLMVGASGTAQVGAAAPDPNEVYVRAISYGGSGCPQGSVGQSLSSDRSTFTLIYDSFVASLGPGVPITDSRKNCQVNINLHVPQGFAFTIASVDYRGFVELDPGTRGVQQATYYFAGQQEQASAASTFYGSTSKDYLAHDEIGLASQVWSACNASAPLNINASVRVSGTPGAQAQMTVDSMDGKFTQEFALQWRHC